MSSLFSDTQLEEELECVLFGYEGKCRAEILCLDSDEEEKPPSNVVLPPPPTEDYQDMPGLEKMEDVPPENKEVTYQITENKMNTPSLPLPSPPPMMIPPVIIPKPKKGQTFWAENRNVTHGLNMSVSMDSTPSLEIMENKTPTSGQKKGRPPKKKNQYLTQIRLFHNPNYAITNEEIFNGLKVLFPQDALVYPVGVCEAFLVHFLPPDGAHLIKCCQNKGDSKKILMVIRIPQVAHRILLAINTITRNCYLLDSLGRDSPDYPYAGAIQEKIAEVIAGYVEKPNEEEYCINYHFLGVQTTPETNGLWCLEIAELLSKLLDWNHIFDPDIINNLIVDMKTVRKKWANRIYS